MKFFFLIVLFHLCLNSIASAKENATWVKSIFFRGFDPTTKKKLTLKDVEDLAMRLKANHIRYAYIFAGPYENDGHLPSYVFSQQAKESIKILKRIYPELKVLPWIGGIQNKTVHLERVDWVKNAISDTAKLFKELSLTGIHLDLEYVLYPSPAFNRNKLDPSNYGVHWVKFHKLLRLALPNKFISSVVVSTASGTKPWKHKHPLKEIKDVSLIVNQISFMFYETNIHELKTYRENLKEQLKQIKDLKSELKEKSPQYLFGVGTFSDQKSLQGYRDLRFENLPTTLKLEKELEQEISPKVSIVDGHAIYCEWMTTEQEWKELRSLLESLSFN
jgi:hypothetical protein